MNGNASGKFGLFEAATAFLRSIPGAVATAATTWWVSDGKSMVAALISSLAVYLLHSVAQTFTDNRGQ